MDVLRSAVLIACGAGIISCIVGSAAIGGSKKAIIRLMINCAAMISLLSPLTGFGPEDKVNDLESYHQTHYSKEDVEEMLKSYDIRCAELSLKLELDKLLKSSGIENAETVITCEMDEYDVIKVSRAEATVKTSADADKLKSLSKDFSEDFPLTVILDEEP